MPSDSPAGLLTIRRTAYTGNLGLFSVLALNYGQEKNADRFMMGSEIALTTYGKNKMRMESTEPDKQTVKLRSLIVAIDSMVETFKGNIK